MLAKWTCVMQTHVINPGMAMLASPWALPFQVVSLGLFIPWVFGI